MPQVKVGTRNPMSVIESSDIVHGSNTIMYTLWKVILFLATVIDMVVMLKLEAIITIIPELQTSIL